MNSWPKFLGAFIVEEHYFTSQSARLSASGPELQVGDELSVSHNEPEFVCDVKRRQIEWTLVRPESLNCYLKHGTLGLIAPLEHFYSEIWNFLLSAKVVSLQGRVMHVRIGGTIQVRISIFLEERVTHLDELEVPDLKEVGADEYDSNLSTYKQQYKQLVLHQYARDAFFTMLRILEIKINEKALLQPKEIDSQPLIDQVIYKKYLGSDHFQYVQIHQMDYSLNQSYYSEQSFRSTLQAQHDRLQLVFVNKISFEEYLRFIQEQSNLPQIDKDVNVDIFDTHQRISDSLIPAPQPSSLNATLYKYQAQAVNWMLYKEGKIPASAIGLTVKDQKLHKLYFAIELVGGEIIYMNFISLRGTEEFVPDQDCCGGILADQMGLGKTIMMLSLILLDKEGIEQQDQDQIRKKIKTNLKEAGSLLVVSLSLFNHWTDQFETNIKRGMFEYFSFFDKRERIPNIKLENYDCVITTYGVLKNDIKDQSILKQYKWKRIILDEAHTIKEEGTKVAQAVKTIESHSKWCLTGTPFHNSIDELFSIFSFLKLDTFSNYSFFNQYISKANKTQKLRILQRILSPIVLRRTKCSKYADGTPIIQLPRKNIDIIYIQMYSDELSIYQAYLKKSKSYISSYLQSKLIKISVTHVFALIMNLRLICVNAIEHLFRIMEKTAKQLVVQQQKRRPKSLEELIDQYVNRDQTNSIDSTNNLDENVEKVFYRLNKLQSQQELNPNGATKDKDYIMKQAQILERKEGLSCCVCLVENSTNYSEFTLLMCGHSVHQACMAQFIEKQQERDEEEIDEPSHSQSDSQVLHKCMFRCKPDARSIKGINIQKLLDYFESQAKTIQQVPESVNYWQVSSKQQRVIEEIQKVKLKSEKVVVFTQFISSINSLKFHLGIEKIQFEICYGALTKEQRKGVFERFSHDSQITVLILQLQVGAFGLNLSAANHVFIVDPWWNPAIEAQAIDRVHRYGQTKEVFVKRFICKDTIEERILVIQQEKERLVREVLELNRQEAELSTERFLSMMFASD